MSFFDFLKTRDAEPAQPAELVSVIVDDLAAIEAERAKLHAQLADYAGRRKAMLVDRSTSEEEILRADVLAERFHARLEKIDAIEGELRDRLQAAKKEIAERTARETFDARHVALDDFRQAMTVALAKLETVKRAHEQHDQAARAAGQSPSHWWDGGPIVVHHESVRDFGRRLKESRAHEDARRRTLDGADV
ncbi:MAG: hypothetical protein ACR652_09755 [Methylocystis sp.]|uniref:hypothetical protein n=1 Tax=Methylocystis sp. TaxID=1911079 RepID=UPI003DA26FA4